MSSPPQPFRSIFIGPPSALGSPPPGATNIVLPTLLPPAAAGPLPTKTMTFAYPNHLRQHTHTNALALIAKTAALPPPPQPPISGGSPAQAASSEDVKSGSLTNRVRGRKANRIITTDSGSGGDTESDASHNTVSMNIPLSPTNHAPSRFPRVLTAATAVSATGGEWKQHGTDTATPLSPAKPAVKPAVKSAVRPSIYALAATTPTAANATASAPSATAAPTAISAVASTLSLPQSIAPLASESGTAPAAAGDDPTASAASIGPAVFSLTSHPSYSGLVAAATAEQSIMNYRPESPPPAANPFQSGGDLSFIGAEGDDLSASALIADTPLPPGVDIHHPIVKKLHAQSVHNSHLRRGHARLSRDNRRMKEHTHHLLEQIAGLRADNQRLIGVTQHTAVMNLELDVLRRNVNTHPDSEYDAVVKTNDTLSNKIKLLTDLMVSMHTERDKLVAQNKTSDADRTALQTKLSDCRAGWERTRRALNATTKTNERLNDTMKRAVAEHDVLMAEHSASKQENARLKHQNSTLSDGRKHDRVHIDTTTKLNAEQHSTIEALKAENSRMTDDLHARRHQLSRTTSELEAATKLVSELTAIKSKHETDRHQTTLNLSALQTTIDQLMSVRAYLEKQVADLHTEIDSWSLRFNERVLRSDEQISILNGKHADSERQLSETAAELKASQRALDDLRSHFEVAKTSIEELTQKHSGVQTELTSALAKVSRLESDLKRTEAALSQERITNVSVLRESEQMRKRLTSVDNELNEWRQRKELVDNQLIDAKRAADVAEKRSTLRANQLLDVQKMLRDRDATVTEWERKYAALTEKQNASALLAHSKQHECTQLVTVLKEVTQRFERARDEAKTYEYEAEEMRRVHASCAGFSAQLTDARTRIDALNAEILGKAAEINKVNADWAVRLADHATCDHDKKQLNSKLSVLTEQHNQLQAAHQQITTSYDILQRAHAPCSSALASMTSKYQLSHTEYERAEHERVRLVTELGSTVSAKTRTEAQLELHRVVIGNLDGDKKKIESELATRLHDVHALTEHKRVLETDLKETRDKYDSLHTELIQLKLMHGDNTSDGRGILQLRTRIQELEHEIDSAKIALTKGEAMTNHLQAEINREHANTQNIISDRDILASKYDALQREHTTNCAAQRVRNEALTEAASKHQSEVDGLGQQLTSVRMELERVVLTHAKCSELDVTIQRLNSELTTVKDKLRLYSESAVTHSANEQSAAQRLIAKIDELAKVQNDFDALQRVHNTVCPAVEIQRVSLENQLRDTKVSLATYEKLTSRVPTLHADQQNALNELHSERIAHEATTRKLSDLTIAHDKCTPLPAQNEQLRKELAFAKSSIAASNELIAKLTGGKAGAPASTPTAAAASASASGAAANSTDPLLTADKDSLIEAVRVSNAEVARLTRETTALLASNSASASAVESLRSQSVQLKSLLGEQKRRESVIDDARTKLKTAKTQLGIVCANASSTVAGAGGVVVTEVRAAQSAADAGILKGDIIESVSGTAIRTQTDLFKALDGVSAGDRLAFQVVRQSSMRRVCTLEIGAVGYTRDQVRVLRRLAHRNDADFDVNLTPAAAALNVSTAAGTAASAYPATPTGSASFRSPRNANRSPR